MAYGTTAIPVVRVRSRVACSLFFSSVDRYIDGVLRIGNIGLAVWSVMGAAGVRSMAPKGT